MGIQHNNTSGFQMYHGDKEDVYGFLRKEVEMAEDGQAIYEFVKMQQTVIQLNFICFMTNNT